MTNKTNGDRLGDVLKADLILSDYTLASDPEERKLYLGLLDKYISSIDDPLVSQYFIKITETKDAEEKDLYTEILMDILSDFKNTCLENIAC